MEQEKPVEPNWAEWSPIPKHGGGTPMRRPSTRVQPGLHRNRQAKSNRAKTGEVPLLSHHRSTKGVPMTDTGDAQQCTPQTPFMIQLSSCHV